MHRALVAALSMLLFVAACTTTSGGGSALDTWDLTDTHAPADVGWETDLTAMEADPSEIRLPGGLVLTEISRANVARDGDRLRSMSVSFPTESVADVVTRAGALAEPLEVDLDPIRQWAAANTNGQDTSPGGALATTRGAALDADTTVSLSTRAFPEGDAVLRVEVLWTS